MSWNGKRKRTWKMISKKRQSTAKGLGSRPVIWTLTPSPPTSRGAVHAQEEERVCDGGLHRCGHDAPLREKDDG